MSDIAKCELFGEPMPAGEEMFKYHGYSGPCPKPRKPSHVTEGLAEVAVDGAVEIIELKKQVERLRAALEEIKTFDNPVLNVGAYARQCANIAKKALEGGNE